MNVDLNCSERNLPILQELLTGRNIHIESGAEVCIVESGFQLPSDRLCILFHPQNLPILLDLLNKMAEPGEDNSKIIGRADGERYVIITHGQILYIESRGNNTYCITHSGEYRIKEKLYELESSLPQDKFIRVSKSFIVNIENVKEILPWFGRRLVLRFIDSKYEVEVSKNYVKTVREFVGF